MVLIVSFVSGIMMALIKGPSLISTLIAWCVILAMVTVLSCADLLFIRIYGGKAAWQERQAKATTRWGLAIFTALLMSPVAFDMLVPSIMQEDVQNEIIVTLYGVIGCLAGVAFFFFITIFRNRPSRLRGILAYGCLAVFVTCSYLLSPLPTSLKS